MVSEAAQRVTTNHEVESRRETASKRIDEETLSFSAFVGILLRGKRTVLFCSLGMLTLTTILAFILPPMYSATTSFVPPGAGGAQNSSALMGQLPALGGIGLLGSNRSQGELFIGILKSHAVAHYLVQRYDLEKVYRVKKESVAEKILGQRSLFETGSKDPIVTVTVTDGDPQRARDLASGYLRALQDTTLGLSFTESFHRKQFFEQRLSKAKDDLAAAESALKQTEENTGFISPDSQTNTQIQTLSQLNMQITMRQAQLAAMRVQETDENPDVVRLISEIDSLQAQFRQLQTGKNKDAFGQVSTAQLPANQLEYVRRARDVKYYETLLNIIGNQYEAARLDEANDSPLQVLDHATVPDTKSGPHRSIIMAIGLLAGSLGGGIVVLIQHARQADLLSI